MACRLTQNQTRQQACDFLALIDLGLTDGGNHEPPRCGSPSTTSLDQASRADGKGGALAEQHVHHWRRLPHLLPPWCPHLTGSHPPPRAAAAADAGIGGADCAQGRQAAATRV